MKILVTPKSEKPTGRDLEAILQLLNGQYRSSVISLQEGGLLLEVEKRLDDSDFDFFNLLKRRLVDSTINVEKFTWELGDIQFDD